MPKVKGYSLWLMPEGETYRSFQALIARLAKQHDSPAFEPHMTLIGQVTGPEEEVTAKTAELAKSIDPYEIRLNSVGRLDEYFRCLFIHAKESKAVIAANLKARQIFGREEDPPYMPHLSLLYGNFTDETKASIVAEIGEAFNDRFIANSIHLYSTKGDPQMAANES